MNCMLWTSNKCEKCNWNKELLFRIKMRKRVLLNLHLLLSVVRMNLCKYFPGLLQWWQRLESWRWKRNLLISNCHKVGRYRLFCSTSPSKSQKRLSCKCSHPWTLMPHWSCQGAEQVIAFSVQSQNDKWIYCPSVGMTATKLKGYPRAFFRHRGFDKSVG